MMDKKIQIVLSAKSKMSAGIAAARKRLGKFSASMKKAFLGIAAAAGTVAVGFASLAKRAISAFSIQEDAVKNLSAAISQVGEDADAVIPRFKAFAAEMQKQTKFGDEAIMSIMAYGKNLGISTDKMEIATQAALGLAAKFNIDLKTAMMLVGRASQGQTQMLTRYGIVMEDTLTPQEKFNKLLAIGADNFGLAQTQAKTTAGQIEQLKNKFGDVLEKIGAVIVKSGIFEKALTFLSEKVDMLLAGDRLQKWADNAKTAFQALAPVVSKIGKAFSFLKGGIEKGAAFAGALAGGSSFREAANMARNQSSPFASTQQQEKASADASAKIMSDLAAQKVALEKEVATASVDIDKEAIEAKKKHAKELADTIRKLEREKADEIARQEDEAKQARIDAAQAALDKQKKAAEEVKKLANMRVADFIEQAKKEKEIEEEKQDAQKRATRLREKIDRGTKLSKKDREFLDAFKAIEAAQEKIKGGHVAADLQQKEDALRRAQDKQHKSLMKIEEELKKTREMQKELLAQK